MVADVMRFALMREGFKSPTSDVVMLSADVLLILGQPTTACLWRQRAAAVVEPVVELLELLHSNLRDILCYSERIRYFERCDMVEANLLRSQLNCLT